MSLSGIEYQCGDENCGVIQGICSSGIIHSVHFKVGYVCHGPAHCLLGDFLPSGAMIVWCDGKRHHQFSVQGAIWRS